MPRLARVVVPGLAHHITQRGNHREQVFFDDEDRRVYLASLAENAERYGMSLLGYCLMRNHVHLIATPQKENSLAKALGRTHNDYARWQHIRHRQSGHLWQNRFFSCVLDSGHCWAALRYIELNPVRAGLTSWAWDWPWSSAAAHTGARADATLEWDQWSACWTVESWREALVTGIADAELTERIRDATRSGRPLGAKGFAAALEDLLGRKLVRSGPGPQSRSSASGAVGVG